MNTCTEHPTHAIDRPYPAEDFAADGEREFIVFAIAFQRRHPGRHFCFEGLQADDFLLQGTVI